MQDRSRNLSCTNVCKWICKMHTDVSAEACSTDSGSNVEILMINCLWHMISSNTFLFSKSARRLLYWQQSCERLANQCLHDTKEYVLSCLCVTMQRYRRCCCHRWMPWCKVCDDDRTTGEAISATFFNSSTVAKLHCNVIKQERELRPVEAAVLSSMPQAQRTNNCLFWQENASSDDFRLICIQRDDIADWHSSLKEWMWRMLLLVVAWNEVFSEAFFRNEDSTTTLALSATLLRRIFVTGCSKCINSVCRISRAPNDLRSSVCMSTKRRNTLICFC